MTPMVTTDGGACGDLVTSVPLGRADLITRLAAHEAALEALRPAMAQHVNAFYAGLLGDAVTILACLRLEAERLALAASPLTFETVVQRQTPAGNDDNGDGKGRPTS